MTDDKHEERAERPAPTPQDPTRAAPCRRRAGRAMPTRSTRPCKARPPRPGSRSRSRSARNGTRKRTAGCRPRCDVARGDDEHADRGLRDHRQRLHRRAGVARRLDRLAVPAALRFGIGLRRAARRAEARALAAGAAGPGGAVLARLSRRNRHPRNPVRDRRRRRDGHRLHAVHRPGGSDRPDPHRARRQGPRADAHRYRPALQLRARHTLGALASRRSERGRGAERGAIRHAGAAARHEGPDDEGRVHGPGRRDRAVHDELVSLAPSRIPLSRSARASARNRERMVRLVEPLHAEGAVARGDRALADHAEDADLSADRRDRRGGDDLAAGSARRRAQLGLPVLLDPRRDADACTRCSARDIGPRRAPGASGCCAPSPGIRRKCRSCTASPASAA